MRATLLFALLLAGCFALTATINLALGVLSAEDVRAALALLARNQALLAAAVVAVLAIDSLLAVPTVTTVVLAGYFLGPALGGLSSTLGILAAGSICFWAGRFGAGRRLISPATLSRVAATVGHSGPTPLLMSRAAPILPEVLSVLAGAGGMPASRYYLYFALGNVPFAFLAAWSGSVSSLDRPWPALIVGVGLPALGGLFVTYRRLTRGRLTAGTPAGERK